MDFFFVGLNKKHFDVIVERQLPVKPNILVAMNNMSYRVNMEIDELKSRGLIGKVALDSGTYTYQKKKNADASVLFYRFLEYAKLHKDKFDIIFSFDKVFTPDGFDENYEYLMELHGEGIPAFPVAHDLRSKDYAKLQELGHNQIAFGQDKDRNLVTLLSANIELLIYGIQKSHLLGIASPKLLMHIPVTSADASSANQHAAFGRVNFYDPDKPYDIYGDHLRIPRKGHAESTDEKYVIKKNILLNWLESMGVNITWEDLKSDRATIFAVLINLLYYIRASEIATKCHQDLIKFIFREHVDEEIV